MTTERYIEPNLKARLLLFFYVIILLTAVYLFTQALNGVGPLIEGDQQQVTIAISFIKDLFYYLLIFSFVHAVVLSVLFITLAKQAKATGSFPPPGTWVLVKTKIKTGVQARRSILWCYICVGLIWLSVLLPIYLLNLLDTVITA